MFLPDPIVFTLNIFGKSINIYWYGILIATGILFCIVYSVKKGKKIGMNTDSVLDMALWAIIFGILGARLFYVVFSWDLYKDNLLSIFQIWNGGLAIYGGVIFGLLGVFIYSKRNKRNYLEIIDIIVPGLIFAQALGRWGNFFNQEAFGSLITNPNLQFFPYAVYIEESGTYHMATFFYESMWNLLVFATLLIYGRKKRTSGNLLFLYFVLYGSGRMFIEALRTDSLYIGSLRVSQVLSILLVIYGLAMLLFRNIKWGKNDKVDEKSSVNPKLKLMADDDVEENDAVEVDETPKKDTIPNEDDVSIEDEE